MGCYNDKVLFIHIPKCGGWAVKTYMQEHLPGVLLPDDEGSNLPIGHVPLRDIERFTGRSPESFERIIAVIRDPYEQQLSQMCFWANRAMVKNGKHVHDIVTLQYVNVPQVMADWAVMRIYGKPFVWLPQHLDLDSFVTDPACDFHTWFEQHYGWEPGLSAEEQKRRQERAPARIAGDTYEQYGGYYRYWLEVNGGIPDNVVMLRQEHLGRELPIWLEPFADHELPRLTERKNASSHLDDAQLYYRDAGREAVEWKFQWTFDKGMYPRCQCDREQPALAEA